MSIFLIFLPLALGIVHIPPKQVYSNEPVSITVEISEEVLTAHLLLDEIPIYMAKDKKILTTTIQGEFVSSPYIKYRIVVKTKDNQAIQSQEYRVTVIEKEELIEMVSPEPYDAITNKKPDIVFLFNHEVSSSDITISLDDIDITQDCEITAYAIYYKPNKVLNLGQHNIKIIIKDLPLSTYTFSIISTRYAHGYISGGIQYAEGKGCEDFFPYKKGFSVPFDIYTNGSFYYPFSLWAYYEESTNFNLEFESPFAKFSIGDIYPTGSLLTLYVASPRGVQINTTSLPIDIEILGGEMEHIDTTVYIDTFVDTIFTDTLVLSIDTLVDTTFSGNYTRYIMGSKVKWEIWKTKMGISYFYGFDDSNSIKLDSNFTETALIDAPVKNYFWGGEIEYPFFKFFAAGAEYCMSKTSNNPNYETQDTVGDAYSVFTKFEHSLMDAKLTYNKISKSYYTIGNPYLDAGKQGFLGELSSSYKNFYYSGSYEIYEIDDTLDYYLYTSLNYTISKGVFKTCPYITHSMLGNSNSVTVGNRFSFNNINLSLSYSQSNSSNSIRGDFEYEIFKNRFCIRSGYGRSQSFDDGEVISLNQNPELEIEFFDRIDIEYKGLFNDNYSDEEYIYQENVFTVKVKHRF